MGEIFERAFPETPLAWTGERLTTESSGQIEIEHLHRYCFARELCRGCDVLDVASGEGYGSVLLSQVAESVVGVDASAETIAHAMGAYARPNLRFEQGDARCIPLPDAAVDVVVSFETIEHFYDHDKFINEVKRVLRPAGRFVVSSPERDVYSPEGGPVNPYHVRELTRHEFTALIRGAFRHVAMYGQRPITGSALVAELPPTHGSDRFVTFERRDATRFEGSDGLPRPLYLIAIASDAPVDAMLASLYIETSDLNAPFLQIATAEEKVRGLSERVASRDEEAHRTQAELVGAQTELVRRDELLARHDREFSALATAYERLQRECATARFERDATQSRLALAENSISWRLTRPLREITMTRAKLRSRVRQLIGEKRSSR